MHAISLAEYPPFIWSKNNACISSAGDYILAYRLQLPERYSLGEKKYTQLLDHFNKTIKNLPASVFLKQDVFLRKSLKSQRVFNDFLARSFYDHFDNRQYTEHHCFIFFILPKSSRLLEADFIKSPFRKTSYKTDVAEPGQKMLQFEKEAKEAVAFLNASNHITVSTFTEKALFDYTRLYFNAFFQHGYTDTIIENGQLRVGDRLVGAQVVRSINQLPDTINELVSEDNFSSNDYDFYRLFLESNGLDLDFDHLVNQVFVLEDQQKHLTRLKSKQGALFGARGFSPGNKIHAEKLKAYLESLVEKSDATLIRFHYNVIYFGKDKEELQANATKLTTRLKSADIIPYVPYGSSLSNIFFNSFFAYVSQLDATSTFLIELSQALCFINPTSTYQNDNEGIWFNNRVDNAPLKRDLWDEKKKRIKARNFIINAPTGEGKTVAALNILFQLLQQGYYLVINDLGDSYHKLCLLFPEVSQYIKFEKGQPLGINPFYLQTEKLEANKLDQLVQFIKTLWKRDEELSTSESTSLRKLITFYYDNVPKNHSFPNFYKFVEFSHKDNLLATKGEIDQEYFDARQFLHVCSEFVKGGSYAYLFKETDRFNLDYDKLQLVVFEYGEAKDDPLLVSILLNLSNEIDYHLVWSNRATRGYIFYDEFAKQLKFPNVLSSVEYKFQAIRKQTAGIGIVLQSPNQLPKGSTASSIIDNTQIFLLLSNQKGYDDVVERYKLDSHDHNQLMSLKNNFAVSPMYSEQFLKIGTYSNVVRLELSETMLAAFLTEGEEHVKIMNLLEEQGSMETAIVKYLKTK